MGEEAGFHIDFGALKNQASEMLDTAEAARAATPEPAVAAVATPVADPTTQRVKGSDTVAPTPKADEPQVEAATEEVAAEPKVATLTDDTLVEVTVDGEQVTMPWKDARAGISRTSKFTKSMQQLASDRKAFENERGTLTQLQQERQQFNAFLANPQAVQAFLKQTAPQLFQTPEQVQAQAQAMDPNAVITYADAQALAKQQTDAALGQVMQQLQLQAQAQDEKIGEATAALEHKQQTAKHSVAINSTLHEIFTANPVLKAVPNVEDVIRYEVAQMVTPQTTEAEALEMFRTVAQGMTENIAQHYTATKKVAAAIEAKTKLATKTIEPKGGAAPTITPQTYKNADGTVNWNKVTEMARNSFGS